MNTSYFAKNAKHPNAVAICAKVPDWFTGRQYRKLAPSWDIFSEWKKTGDNALYTRRFNYHIKLLTGYFLFGTVFSSKYTNQPRRRYPYVLWLIQKPGSIQWLRIEALGL